MSDDARWPRVLFVTPCAFNAVTGGGVTFSNLFRGWPAQRLATVTSDSVPVTHDVCEHYHFVGDEERLAPPPLRWLPRLPGPLARVARALLPAERGRIGERLARFADAFRPDLIYTIGGDLVTMDLVEALRRRFDVPVVSHLMDDGVTEPRGRGLFGRHYERSYARSLHNLLDQSAVRMGICDAMAREYETRYEKAFDSFCNTVDVAEFAAARRATDLRNDPARLVYVGSIYPIAQDRSLIEIARAVEDLRSEGTELRLEVHAAEALFGHYRSQVELGPNLSFVDVSEDQQRFVELVTGADALLLPVNFDAASVRFIRLSMPTKVPAYLASGTPILVYGPASVAQVQYAREAGWGLVVDEHDPGALAKAIVRIVSDAPLRSELVARALETAREHHDASRVRERFWRVLAAAARRAPVDTPADTDAEARAGTHTNPESIR